MMQTTRHARVRPGPCGSDTADLIRRCIQERRLTCETFASRLGPVGHTALSSAHAVQSGLQMR